MKSRLFILLLLMVSMGGCGGCGKITPGPPAKDYDSYQPSKGWWAIEIKNTDAISQEDIEKAVKSVEGVDILVVELDAGYLAFHTKAHRNLEESGKIKRAVVEQLEKAGVDVGKQKSFN